MNESHTFTHAYTQYDLMTFFPSIYFTKADLGYREKKKLNISARPATHTQLTRRKVTQAPF